MRKIIHYLRRQPHEIRIYVLYFLTAIAGVILFSLWVYSLGGSADQPTLAESAKNDLAPLSALKGNFIDGYNILTNNDGQGNN